MIGQKYCAGKKVSLVADGAVREVQEKSLDCLIRQVHANNYKQASKQSLGVGPDSYIRASMHVYLEATIANGPSTKATESTGVGIIKRPMPLVDITSTNPCW